MEKLEYSDYMHYRNALHFQYFVEIRDLINRSNIEALKIADLFPGFVSNLNDEDAALKKINTSAKTKLIHDADVARDKLYGGMVSLVHAFLKHFNPQKSEAAREIAIVLKTYGNLLHMGLHEQTSNMYNMLQDLQKPKYSVYITRLGMGEWIEELVNSNSALDSLVKERYDETVTRCTIVVREARARVDASYHAIVDRINAYITIEGISAYADFVRTVNAIIAKYKMYKVHHRHENGTTNEETEVSEEAS